MEEIKIKTQSGFEIKKRSLLPLLWLTIVFLLPAVGAYVLFYCKDAFSIPLGTMHTGTLLSPPIEASTLPFYKAQEGKWQIIYLSPAPQECDAECQELSKLILKFPKALGKYQDKIIAKITLHKENTKENIRSGDILLIDPKGWIILYYPKTTEPRKILKDVQRLLRTSAHV